MPRHVPAVPPPSRPAALLGCLLLVACAVLVPPPARAVSDPVGTWPLRPEPEVLTAFDPPATPYAAGHRGVDLLGAAGRPVLAALPGRVTFAGSIAGRGVVVLGHGPTRTTYEPVAASLAVGAEVVAGAPIGTLQAGPSHCAPRTCLHWGWIEGETYLDPLRLVGAGPVRLLPLTGPAYTPLPPLAGSAFTPLLPLGPAVAATPLLAYLLSRTAAG